MASNSINFFNMSNKRDDIIPRNFNRFRKEYRFTYDDNGVRKLVVSREIDAQSEIQAFANDCNIYNILNKYLYGDTSALNQVSTSYADLVGTPKTLHEALNLSIRLKNDFYNLKPEVRAEFNNDFNQYITSISNGKFVEIFKKYNVSEKVESTETVKEDE